MTTKTLRMGMNVLAAKLGGSKDADSQRLSAISQQSPVVVAALDAYCEKARAFAAASRHLYEAVEGFYPPSGPMTGVLAELTKNAGTPWSDDFVVSRAELMKATLNNSEAGTNGNQFEFWSDALAPSPPSSLQLLLASHSSRTASPRILLLVPLSS